MQALLSGHSMTPKDNDSRLQEHGAVALMSVCVCVRLCVCVCVFVCVCAPYLLQQWAVPP